jgi:hypothetical protein
VGHQAYTAWGSLRYAKQTVPGSMVLPFYTTHVVSNDAPPPNDEGCLNRVHCTISRRIFRQIRKCVCLGPEIWFSAEFPVSKYAQGGSYYNWESCFLAPPQSSLASNFGLLVFQGPLLQPKNCSKKYTFLNCLKDTSFQSIFASRKIFGSPKTFKVSLL